MRQLLNVYKPISLTPLQVIDKLRLIDPLYTDIKIGYAGRLDPLAHGVLLLMIGEETKHRERYQDLPKIYEFEALFGLETDTYDLMGLLDNRFLVLSSQLSESGSSVISQSDKTTENRKQKTDTWRQIQKFIKSKVGTYTQPYPPFSSKAVGGKPLHWWAKQNRLSEITIPARQITIYSFELLSTGETSAEDLKKKIFKEISSIQGYFRQNEILETWDTYFNSQSKIRNQQFTKARFRISCSSGTYVRGLIHELGQRLGCGALATEIFRTRVGEYAIEDSLKLF